MRTHNRNDGGDVYGQAVSPTGTLGLPLCVGDADADGDVELGDYALLPECLTGPDAGLPGAGCAGFDAQPDGDIDMADFAAFQTCFGG